MVHRRTLPCLLASVLTAAAAAGAAAQPLEASADRIEEGLRILTGVESPPTGGDPIVSRYIKHPGNADAVQWILGELAVIEGLELEVETFDAAGVEDLDTVIATLHGGDPALQPLLLGAHLDSIASFSPGWDGLVDPAPGADDDASGVAAVMECARLLATSGVTFERDVVFTLFNAEEQGLLGSFEHVDRRLVADDPVALALILDPVGYNPGDLLFFTFDDVSSPDADAFLERVEALDPDIEVSGVHESLIGGDMRADHYPFWVVGWPALHLGTFPQPPTYHTVDDTLDGVDVEFTAVVTSLVCEHAFQLAGPLPPEPDGEGDGEGEGGCRCGQGAGPAASTAAPLLLVFAWGIRRRRG
jgi:hypothetical protein